MAALNLPGLGVMAMVIAGVHEAGHETVPRAVRFDDVKVRWCRRDLLRRRRPFGRGGLVSLAGRRRLLGIVDGVERWLVMPDASMIGLAGRLSMLFARVEPRLPAPQRPGVIAATAPSLRRWHSSDAPRLSGPHRCEAGQVRGMRRLWPRWRTTGPSRS